MTRAQVAMLPDGRRMHLQDGPIDLVIEAFGTAASVRTAYRMAAARFATILDELCTELPLLRAQAASGRCALQGALATLAALLVLIRAFRAGSPSTSNTWTRRRHVLTGVLTAVLVGFAAARFTSLFS